MTVKAILAAKGGDVLTIEPTANLAAAAKMLAERKIGALVVTGADRRIVGIVSERDIVQELAAHGAASLDLPLVIAHQAQKLTLMDALVFAMIGRTRNWGISAGFRAVRVRAPANRPGKCGTFHGPEPYRGLGSSRIVLWQGLSIR